jgi:hypothetical protein
MAVPTLPQPLPPTFSKLIPDFNTSPQNIALNYQTQGVPTATPVTSIPLGPPSLPMIISVQPVVGEYVNYSRLDQTKTPLIPNMLATPRL